jgi:N-acetylmuramoyl-L-alanine amidase
MASDEDSLFLANLENQAMSHFENRTNDTEPSKKSDVTAILEDLKRQHRTKLSLRLSQEVAKTWKNAGEPQSIRQGPFYVVSKANTPAILIELGFLTHPKDAQKLGKPEYHAVLAQKIYDSIKNFKETIDNKGAKNLN